jgi:diguanylate cyclase
MRFDALTGVFNKSSFGEALRNAASTSRSSATPFSLMVLDLDHFKKINDTHGHVVGDGVLCELCSVAREAMGPDGTFGRVGGEEFAALLEGASAKKMAEVAERVRKATEAHKFSFEGKRLAVTVSIGVAEYMPALSESVEELYERADAKLYEAKGAGRNRVCF